MTDEKEGKGEVMKTKIRSFAMDFQAIAKETGCTKGKVCYSEVLGWGVQDGNGEADFCCITAPEVGEGEELRVENDEWCVYA